MPRGRIERERVAGRDREAGERERGARGGLLIHPEGSVGREGAPHPWRRSQEQEKKTTGSFGTQVPRNFIFILFRSFLLFFSVLNFCL